MAVYRIAFESREKIQGKNLLWYTDCKNLMYIINSGSNIQDLHLIALNIDYLLRENSATLKVNWIPREANQYADYLSRKFDSDDWRISDAAFDMLNNSYGQFDIDRFATDYNNHCVRFNSRWMCQGSAGVDAFERNWATDKNWWVPPPRLIVRCLRKIVTDAAEGVLVIPKWEGSVFWPVYKSLCSSGIICNVINLGNSVVEKGRGNGGVFDDVPLKFDMIACVVNHKN